MKDFIEYQKNKRIAKRELAKAMAIGLPALNRILGSLDDLSELFMKYVEGTKDVDASDIVQYTVNSIAGSLSSGDSTLNEIQKYVDDLLGDGSK